MPKGVNGPDYAGTFLHLFRQGAAMRSLLAPIIGLSIIRILLRCNRSTPHPIRRGSVHADLSGRFFQLGGRGGSFFHFRLPLFFIILIRLGRRRIEHPGDHLLQLIGHFQRAEAMHAVGIIEVP